MASNNLSAAILFIFSLLLLLFSTFSGACDPCQPKPKPTPTPTPAAPPVSSFCPRDKLVAGVCLGLRGKNGININIGVKPSEECCALVKDLANVEAAACLCTTLESLVGVNLINVPVVFSTFLSACGKSIPPGFQCEY